MRPPRVELISFVDKIVGVLSDGKREMAGGLGGPVYIAGAKTAPLRMLMVSSGLGPVFNGGGDGGAGFLEVLRHHDRHEFEFGIEPKKERLGDRRDL